MKPPAKAPGSGRADYDQLAHFRQLAPGEPYFLIRGHDLFAGDGARGWAKVAHEGGAPIAVVEQALRQADKLDAWPTKKVPDAAHLTPAERKQLEYAFGRRAWEAREDCADMRIMLAEERGLQSAMARLRPLLALFFARGRWAEDGTFVYDPKATHEGLEIAGPDAIAALRNLNTVLSGGGRAA